MRDIWEMHATILIEKNIQTVCENDV